MKKPRGRKPRMPKTSKDTSYFSKATTGRPAGPSYSFQNYIFDFPQAPDRGLYLDAVQSKYIHPHLLLLQVSRPSWDASIGEAPQSPGKRKEKVFLYFPVRDFPRVRLQGRSLTTPSPPISKLPLQESREEYRSSEYKKFRGTN